MEETGIKPVVIKEIKALAEQYHINRVVLFGSRARGDYYVKSDIDLAVSGGDKTGFALDVDELASTLLQFDVVDLEGAASGELLESIKKDGVVLYEKI